METIQSSATPSGAGCPADDGYSIEYSAFTSTFRGLQSKLIRQVPESNPHFWPSPALVGAHYILT